MQIEPMTKIWLVFGGDKFLLPVNPSDIEINNTSPYETFKIVGSGQIGVPQFPDLTTVKFKSFLPGNPDNPYTSEDMRDITYYVTMFQEAMKEADVGRLVINRPSGWDMDMPVIIKSFKPSDKGGEPLDVNYSIELVEYRDYEPEKIVINQTKKSANTKKKRATSKVMRVGATVVANGTYCYDSYGSKPHGNAKNIKTTVKRIVKGRAYPILIGSYGWIKESNLQIKG